MTWNNPLAPTRANEALDAHYRYPRSESEWQARYALLRAAYSMEPYTAVERLGWHLFEALDDDQKKIAETVRLLRDFSFIIDSNAHALFAGGLDIDVATGTPKQLKMGEGIWRRSRMHANLAALAHNVCLGRCGIEVQRLPRAAGVTGYQTILVVHPPETYLPIYDDQSRSELVRVVIVDQFYSDEDLDENGNVTAGAEFHTYRREITSTETITTLDGDVIEAQSGKHSAGVVPFVNLVLQPTREPEHGPSAAAGIEPALALADSMFTQSHATGARFADPKTLAKGVDFSGTKGGIFGRVISWASMPGSESSITYLEPTMKGIDSLLETIDRLLEQVRSTYPEFALFRAGSDASGEALKTLGQAFERKILSARAGILPEIARILGVAVAMEENHPFDADADLFKIKVGPVLPVDLKAEVEMVSAAVDGGLLTRADGVRRMQVVGLVGAEHDPEEYAAEAEDGVSTTARKFFTPAPKQEIPDGDEPEK